MKKLVIAILLAFAFLMTTTQALEIKLEMSDKALIEEDIPINFTIKNNETKNLTNLKVELFDNGNKIYNKTISLKIEENLTENLTFKMERGWHLIVLKVNDTIEYTKYLRVAGEEEYSIDPKRNPILLNQQTEVVIFIENNGNKNLTNLNIGVFDNDLQLDSFTIPSIEPGESFTKNISFKSSVKGLHKITLKVNGTVKAEKELNVITVAQEQPKVDLSLLYAGLIILLVLVLVVVIKKFKLFKTMKK